MDKKVRWGTRVHRSHQPKSNAPASNVPIVGNSLQWPAAILKKQKKYARKKQHSSLLWLLRRITRLPRD